MTFHEIERSIQVPCSSRIGTGCAAVSVHDAGLTPGGSTFGVRPHRVGNGGTAWAGAARARAASAKTGGRSRAMPSKRPGHPGLVKPTRTPDHRPPRPAPLEGAARDILAEGKNYAIVSIPRNDGT